MDSERNSRTAAILNRITGKEWKPLRDLTEVIKHMDYFNPAPGCVISANLSHESIVHLEKYLSKVKPAYNSAVSGIRSGVDVTKQVIAGTYRKVTLAELQAANARNAQSDQCLRRVIEGGRTVKQHAEKVYNKARSEATYFIVKGESIQKKYSEFLGMYGRPILMSLDLLYQESSFKKTWNSAVDAASNVISAYAGFFFNTEDNYVIYRSPKVVIRIEFKGSLNIVVDKNLLRGFKFTGDYQAAQSMELEADREGLKAIFEGFYFDAVDNSVGFSNTAEKGSVTLYNSALTNSRLKGVDASWEFTPSGSLKKLPGLTEYTLEKEVKDTFKFRAKESLKAEFKGKLILKITEFDYDNNEQTYGTVAFRVPVPQAVIDLIPGRNGRIDLKPGSGVITNGGFQANAPTNSGGVLLNQQLKNNRYTVEVHTQNPFLPAAGVGIAALSLTTVGATLYFGLPYLAAGAEVLLPVSVGAGAIAAAGATG